MPKHWSKLEDFERVLNFMYALEGGNRDRPMKVFQRITGWSSDRVKAAFHECVNDEREMHKQFPALAGARKKLIG